MRRKFRRKKKGFKNNPSEKEENSNQNKSIKDKHKEKHKVKEEEKDNSMNEKVEESEEKNEGYFIPYILVDDSITKINSVFKEGDNLIADVERNKNGKIIRERMRTKDIKENNPWVLINYYESRIKFGL